ncbi:MAG: hypothetical protein ABRQ25_01840 [Clostridiaceae bacterium]
MDIFNLSPEEISALSLVIAIALSKQYTDDDQLGILAVFFTAIGDILGLIQLQRLTLTEKVQKAQNDGNDQESNGTGKNKSSKSGS